MALEGIAGVQARMTEIQGRFASLDPLAPAPAPATTPGPEFASVLDSALAEATGGATATGPLPGAAALSLPSVFSSTATSGGSLLAPATAGTTAVAAPGPIATGLTTPALRQPAGAFGRLQPPADLVRFGNGRVPAEALAPLGHGSHRLWAPASTAFARLEADAAAAGVRIGVTDSYRSFDEQVDVARRKGLHSSGGLAAVPGTSAHGWGLALDLDLDATAQRWMRDNAWKYGFVEDVPREPWHWTYRPAPPADASAPGRPGAGAARTSPSPQ